MQDNLNPREGTVSFWFAPQGDIPEKYIHCYCCIPFKGGVFAVQQQPGYKGKLIFPAEAENTVRTVSTTAPYTSGFPGCGDRGGLHSVIPVDEPVNSRLRKTYISVLRIEAHRSGHFG